MHFLVETCIDKQLVCMMGACAKLKRLRLVCVSVALGFIYIDDINLRLKKGEYGLSGHWKFQLSQIGFEICS